MFLPDGSVIPSFLTVEHATDESKSPGDNNFALKVGSIVKVYYPDNPVNINKKRIEYDVQVQERKGRGGFNVSLYKHCTVSDMFGGLADSLEFTHRASSNPTEPTPTFQDGNAVLLLCLHGDTNFGTIVGGLRNAHRESLASTERGHFLNFEFNGIQIEINKDGELALTYKSQTDLHGVPQDPASGGSFVKIDKTGSIEINDAKAGRIKIDKATSDITIETIKGNVIINAQKTIQETAGQEYVATAPLMKFGGEGSDEQMVLGNQLVAFLNSQVVPKINALIAAVGLIAGGSSSTPHTHDVTDETGTWTTGGPSADTNAAAALPSPAAPSGQPQLSDFCFTKKTP